MEEKSLIFWLSLAYSLVQPQTGRILRCAAAEHKPMLDIGYTHFRGIESAIKLLTWELGKSEG